MSGRKAELLAQLNILQRKEEEVANMIMALDSNFRELGYQVDSTVDVSRKRIMPQTGIRMRGQLSFRGKEKASEYFDTIDIDHDGQLNYEDFRAMLAFGGKPVGYVNAPEVHTSEAWRMFMTDCGLTPSEMGGISRDQFTEYRAMIEQQQPLTTELEYLNLGYLPPRLKDWQRIRALLSEQMDFRDSRLPPGAYADKMAQKNAANARAQRGPSRQGQGQGRGGGGRQEKMVDVTPDMRDETFTIEDLSYILSNLNIGSVLTKPEIALLLLGRSYKQRVMEQLLFKYAKRNLSAPDFPFNLDDATGRLALRYDEGSLRVSVEDMKSIQRKDIAPWLMAVPTLFDSKEIYRQAIKWKNRFIRGIRHFEWVTRHMFHFAAHLNDRLVFREYPPFSRLSKHLQEVSSLKFGVVIGEESRREGGISGNFKLLKIDTPGVYFKQLKVPPDSGSVLMVDWLFHADTTEEDAHRCAITTRQFLGHHLEKELRTNKAFAGMTITTAINESDDSKVLRLLFAYKRIVALDGWFDHMLIPYGVNDFVNLLVGDFRSNFDLAGAISNKVTSLSESFACSFDCTLGYRRNLIMELLQRLLLAVSAGMTPDQVDEKQAQSAGEHAPTGTKADNKRGPTTAQAIAAEESVRRVERWRYVHPFFPFVRKWTSFFLNTLKCMKTAALRLKYSDIGDFIYKMGILDVSFGRYMQRGWTHRVGYLREKFQKFSQEYVRQLSELHLRLKTYLENKKRDDEARRKRELIEAPTVQPDPEVADAATTAREQQEASTLERLRRMGIDTHGRIFEDAADSPADYLNLLNEEAHKQDVMNLIALENLRKHVIGLHSFELVTGKAKLSCTVQGVDIFDVLPDLPNMQSVQDANSLRPAKKPQK